VIDRRRGLHAGLLALLVSVVLPAALSALAGLGPFRPPADLGSFPSLTAEGVDLYARWSYQNRFLLPVYGVILGLVLWVAAAALIHALVRALGGHGDFAGYLKLVGFAALVGLIGLPAAALDTVLKLLGSARAELLVGQLVGVIGVGVFAWQNLLLIVAARAHYGISTERAVTAVIGPVGCIILLAIALLVAAALLAVVARP
jgi:hypothetical protein